MEKRLIGEYLIAEHKITPEQLQRALEMQANSMSGGRMPLIGTILVQQGVLHERDLTASLQHQESERNEANPAMYPPEIIKKG